MSKLLALGSGPVEFTDLTSGSTVSLPLSSIYFENSQIQAEGGVYTAHKSALDPLLAHLATTGAIRPGPPPAAKPAMVVSAKAPGAAGNSVVVEFLNFDSSAAPPAFDSKVSEVDIYRLLKPETVQTVLGSAAGAGLVFVPGSAPGTGDLPKAGTYSLTVTSPATVAAVEIPKSDGSGDAFTVQAKADGDEGSRTTVEIADVDTAASTFTLTARWTKTATHVAAADLAAQFAYELTIAPPDGAANVSTPAAAAINLSGGQDASTARSASAVAMA